MKAGVICSFTTLFFVLLYGVMMSGCGSIRPYSLVSILPDNQHVNVILPSSKNMRIYDSTLAEQWDRTFNYCAQFKRAIAVEIDEREDRLTIQKSWLLGIGGLAGVANTIYSGIRDEPEKTVIIPLSIISGASLFTLLPSFTKDERLDFLKEKLDNIIALQSKAVTAFNEVESVLLSIGILNLKLDSEHPLREEESKTIRAKMDTLDLEAEGAIAKLRQSLVDWSNEAQ